MFGSLGSIGGALISGGLSFLGARDANKRSQNQFDSNYKLARDQLYSGYSIAARDLKNAGINPILAGKWGPASTSTPAMSNFQNTGQAFTEGYNTMSTAQKSQSQGKLTETQNAIAENIEYFSDEVKRAYDNSGKNVTDFIANTSWHDLGNMIGNSIGLKVDQIVEGLKSMFGTVEQAILKLLGKGKSGPVKGDATHPTYQTAPMTGTIQR